MNVLNTIERETVVNGGCSYSLSVGDLILPGSPLYALSLHKELEEIIPMEEFGVSRIRMFIIKNSEVLWQPNIAVGTWVLNDRVYLDVTTLLDKGQTTLEQLREMTTDQMAAWDMEINQIVNL
jgi:hypothetical protein